MQVDLTNDVRARLQASLVSWFHGARRALPWRQTLAESPSPAPLAMPSAPTAPDRNPYAVWVSEIMLQQTQVVTVIPYFHRFMARFPTIDALAEAPLEDVLSLWRGLGYYARARNLHRGAQWVHTHAGGALPASLEAILQVPGIGRYTAGAILSLAYGLPVSLLDGNVARVLARVLGVTLDPKLPAGQKGFWALADRLVPTGVAHDAPGATAGQWNEALMELGALVCTPAQPQCRTCPLQSLCYAATLDDPTVLPTRGEKKSRPDVHAVALRLVVEGRQLMFLRPPEGLLGGLWELPGMVVDEAEPLSRVVPQILAHKLGLAPDTLKVSGPSVEVEHIFTHLRLLLRVVSVSLVEEHADGLSRLNAQLEARRAHAKLSSERSGSRRGRGVHAVEVEWQDHRWVDEAGLGALPMGRATTKALEMLAAATSAPPPPQLKLF